MLGDWKCAAPHLLAAPRCSRVAILGPTAGEVQLESLHWSDGRLWKQFSFILQQGVGSCRTVCLQASPANLIPSLLIRLHTAPHSRCSRGADEALGRETGSRGRPAAARKLTTGLPADSETATRPSLAAESRSPTGGIRSMHAPGKPDRVKRLSPLNYQVEGASARDQSRFIPCLRDASGPGGGFCCPVIAERRWHRCGGMLIARLTRA